MKIVSEGSTISDSTGGRELAIWMSFHDVYGDVSGNAALNE
jgi:hypothetical protein